MADRRPIAIVTGGARGIGLGISRALAATGWDLAVVGVRPSSEVQNVSNELEKSGARVQYVQTDLGDPRQRGRVVDEVLAVGIPSALVNNAGRAPRVRADTCSMPPRRVSKSSSGPNFRDVFPDAVMPTR